MIIQIEPPSTKPVTAGPNWTAFLSLGFRPFYTVGATWAVLSILLWVFFPLSLQGVLNHVWWHAHEMLWGFVLTIAVGFLLTASANWTGHNPAKNKRLVYLLVLWLVARLAFLLPSMLVFLVAACAECLFFISAAVFLGQVIFKAKSRRNYILPCILGLVAMSDALYLGAVALGKVAWLIHFFEIGLILMVFIALLIGRRVIPFFAKRGAGIEIPMHQQTGQWQLYLTVFTWVMTLFQWSIFMAIGLIITGALSLVQVWQWKPAKVLRIPLLWVLYLSYFLLGLGLILAGLHWLGVEPAQIARPAFYIHVIGVGGFSVMIMGMITRTALGHTGRALKADKLMTTAYVLVACAALARLVAVYPSAYSLMSLHLSATLWILAFGLYLWRFVPFLTTHRADHPGMKRHMLKSGLTK